MTNYNIEMRVEQMLRAAVPLLDGLETGQDCEDYAFAKGKHFQAMTFVPEAFEALRAIPEAADLIDTLKARIAELEGDNVRLREANDALYVEVQIMHKANAITSMSKEDRELFG